MLGAGRVNVSHSNRVLPHLGSDFALQFAPMWNSSNPSWVCGFGVDRGTAEQMLQGQPPGAFLLRLHSEPGCIAVSCNVETSTGDALPGSDVHRPACTAPAALLRSTASTSSLHALHQHVPCAAMPSMKSQAGTLMCRCPCQHPLFNPPWIRSASSRAHSPARQCCCRRGENA